MTALPAGVQYGTMRLHAVAAVRDDTTDSDRDPNSLPVAGTITFTPGTKSVVAADGTKVFLAEQVHGIGSDGILYDPDGQQGVKFVADFEATGWTWTVTPNLFVPGVGGDPDMPIEWPAFSVHLEPGDDLNLATEAPVTSSSGTPIVRGLQGVPGPPGVTPRGAWNSAAAYVVRDAVSYNGTSWVALVPNTNVTPVEGATWSVLAAKGDPGSIANLDTNTAALITAASSTRTALDARYATTTPDASSTVKGKIQLAGDLGGTAAAPTVPGLAAKANTANLAAVATTGAYGDLSGRPTIPAAYTDEQAQDAAAAMIAAGAHSGVSFAYNDAANSLSATVVFPNAPMVAYKSSDTSRASTTTLTDDPALVLSSVPVGVYLVEGLASFVGSSAAGVKLQVKGPSGATSSIVYGGVATDVTVDADSQAARIVEAGALSRGIGGSTATPYAVRPYGTMVITTAGAVSFQWAQNTSSATATVAKSGAFLRLTKIA